MWARLVLTFDVMPQNRSVVILPSLDREGGGGVRLTALVPCDYLNLAAVPVLAFWDVKMPHSIVDQLMSASLNKIIQCKVRIYTGFRMFLLLVLTGSLSKYKES